LFSLSELIQICVANLPPREYTFKGETEGALKPRKVVYYNPVLDSEFPLNVEWKGELAAGALRKLLSDYKLHLNLRYDGDVDIFFENEAGEYDPEEKLVDLLGDTKKGQVFSFKPPSAIVVGRPTIYETTVRRWVPVTVSDGTISGYPEGMVVPLTTALSAWGYPIDKMRNSLVTWFDGKDSKAFDDTPGGGIVKDKRKKILKETAYQWFQAYGFARYIPILPHRIKKSGAEYYEVPDEVRATWFEAKKEKDPLKGCWRNVFYQDGKDMLKEVDRDLLILKFKQPMGSIEVVRAKDADVISAAKTTKQNLKAARTAWRNLQLGINVATSIARVRAWSAALLEDFSITNLHVCDFLEPAIEYKFMYIKRDNLDASSNGAVADDLLSGRVVDVNPLASLEISDRFTYQAGSAIPEVIQSEIQVYMAEEWSNLAESIKEAARIIHKRFAASSIRDLKDIELGGLCVVPNSGKITQVAWESDGELASTKVRYGDFIRGIDNRAGIDWKEKPEIVVKTVARVD